MDFLKKHYEKVLLGVVLLGLVVGAVFLILMIPSERAALLAKSDAIIKKPATPLPALDLSKAATLIGRAGDYRCLDLANTNKVFNPVQWLRKGDDNSTLKKIAFGNEIGIEAVEVSRITPLHTTITFEAVLSPPTAEGPGRYDLVVEKEAATRSSQRTRRHTPASLNTKTETFVIREIKGPPENPTELVIELVDSGERVAVSKEKPFRRVDAYVADFKYAPDNKSWNNQRVGAGGPGTPGIMIAGESYILVAINHNEVVFSAKSNQKKTPRPYVPAA